MRLQLSVLVLSLIVTIGNAHWCINEYWDYDGATVYKNQVLLVGGCGPGQGSQMAMVSTNSGQSWKDVTPNSTISRLWNMNSVEYFEGFGGYVSAGYIASMLSSKGTDFQNWTRSEPVGPRSLKQSFSLNAMLYLNNILYVVGDAGTLFTTTNLVDWTFVSQIRDQLHHYQFFYGIAYGNGVFVLCGGQYEAQGPIIWSRDGATWYQASRALSYAYLRDIIFIPNKGFYAVGESGSANYGVVQTSQNGQNWTQNFQTATKETTFHALAFGNGIIVIVGKSIFVSKDFGTSWIEVKNTPVKLTSISWLRDVTFGNGQFVAVGNYNKVWFSKDGINWVARAPKGSTLTKSGNKNCSEWKIGTMSGYDNLDGSDDFHPGCLAEYCGTNENFLNNVSVVSILERDFEDYKYHNIEINWNGKFGIVQVWDECVNADCPDGRQCCTDNARVYGGDFLIDVDRRALKNVFGISNYEKVLDKVEYRICQYVDPNPIVSKWKLLPADE